MSVTRVDHFTILTDNLPATLAFYERFVGLVPGPRPPFTFPGAWLYTPGGDQAMLHIIAEQPSTRLIAGVIDHMAFFGADLQKTVARLTEAKIEFALRRLPGYETWQLFFHDPNGAKVEIDFDRGETAPRGY